MRRTSIGNIEASGVSVGYLAMCKTMNLVSLVWAIIIILDISLQAIAGVVRDSKRLATRSEKVATLGQQRHLIKMRSGKSSLGLEEDLGGNQSNQQEVSVENIPGEDGFLETVNGHHQPIHTLRGYGIFNTDMYSCDVILLRSCQKPSDCDGCLGLFTCKMPEGKCDLKAVSGSSAHFYQSLQSS